MKKIQNNNGFLVVASKKRAFYSLAINAIESVKDYWPEAKFCLVTEPRFLDSRSSVADHILECDNNVRAKMWGMIHSPFERTLYIDADMQCEHEDVHTVFDLKPGYDLVFTRLTKDREYCYVQRTFGRVEFKHGGGVVMFNNLARTREFVADWYKLFNKHYYDHMWPSVADDTVWTDNRAEWDLKKYPRTLRQWDQFSLWWLLNKTVHNCSVTFFDDDARWNYYSKYRDHLKHNIDPVVLRHFSSGKDIHQLEQFIGE